MLSSLAPLAVAVSGQDADQVAEVEEDVDQGNVVVVFVAVLSDRAGTAGDKAISRAIVAPPLQAEVACSSER